MHFTGIEFATGSLRMLYMLYSCFTHALRMLYACFTHALLMLYSCFTTGSLLGGILGDLAEAADYYRFSRLVN
jgi:hypothetical protein